jgi:hypothetical protein
MRFDFCSFKELKLLSSAKPSQSGKNISQSLVKAKQLLSQIITLFINNSFHMKNMSQISYRILPLEVPASRAKSHT